MPTCIMGLLLDFEGLLFRALLIRFLQRYLYKFVYIYICLYMYIHIYADTGIGRGRGAGRDRDRNRHGYRYRYRYIDIESFNNFVALYLTTPGCPRTSRVVRPGHEHPGFGIFS